MVWFVSFIHYSEEYIFRMAEIPPDFFEWVNSDGSIIDPEDGVPHLLGSKMPEEIDCSRIYPSQIESGRVFEDIRYRMSESFFGKCLEDHKEVVERAAKATRLKEKERLEAQKRGTERKAEERKKTKEAWLKRCKEMAELTCRECSVMLWHDETAFNTDKQKRYFRCPLLCYNCSKKPVSKDGKVVRCEKAGCERTVNRSRYTSRVYETCQGCNR